MEWHVVRNDFPKMTRRMESNAAAIVAKAALDWEAQAKALAPVLTGTLKNSIQAIQVNQFYWRVVVNVEYGAYVEFGTVHSPAQPFFGPAGQVVRPQFRAAMKSLFGGGPTLGNYTRADGTTRVATQAQASAWGGKFEEF